MKQIIKQQQFNYSDSPAGDSGPLLAQQRDFLYAVVASLQGEFGVEKTSTHYCRPETHQTEIE